MLYETTKLAGNPFSHFGDNAAALYGDAKGVISGPHAGDSLVNGLKHLGSAGGDAVVIAADVAAVGLVGTSLVRWLAKDTPVEKAMIRAYNFTRDKLGI